MCLHTISIYSRISFHLLCTSSPNNDIETKSISISITKLALPITNINQHHLRPRGLLGCLSVHNSTENPSAFKICRQQYSCLEKSHGQRSLVGYSSRCHKESDTTEQLHCHLQTLLTKGLEALG